MKRLVIGILLVMLAGCSSDRIRSYIEDPPSLLRDPHFAEYQQEMDDLESSYLHKEITYAEYMERKGRLEDTYSKEIQERRDAIEDYHE